MRAETTTPPTNSSRRRLARSRTRALVMASRRAETTEARPRKALKVPTSLVRVPPASLASLVRRGRACSTRAVKRTATISKRSSSSWSVSYARKRIKIIVPSRVARVRSSSTATKYSCCILTRKSTCSRRDHAQMKTIPVVRPTWLCKARRTSTSKRWAASATNKKVTRYTTTIKLCC